MIPKIEANEIVFVDSGIESLQDFLTGLVGNAEVVVLDPTRDGVQQITETLVGKQEISGIHIFSHGEPGRLHLGTAQLNADTLKHYAQDLQLWRKALQTGADILLYGCNVAFGDRGATFVQTLSQLTGADVAASTDLTGSSALGGDWDFEIEMGEIETAVAAQPWLTESYDAVFPEGHGSGAQASFIIQPPDPKINTSSTYSAGSFKITNTSTSGQKINRVLIDISSAIFPDIVFDPFGKAGDTVPKNFTIDSGGSATGFVSYNFQKPHDGGYDALEIFFNDFNPGETFTFSIDNDPTSTKGMAPPGPNDAASISGLELIGTQITLNFNDGTTLTGETYRIPNSLVGSQTTITDGLLAEPQIEVLGISTSSTVSNVNQTVRVKGPTNTPVALLVVEGALFTNSGNGFDLDPFEANTAIGVTEKFATIGTTGYVDIPITLTKSNASGGLNYIRAVLKDSHGNTSMNSSTMVLALVSSGVTLSQSSGATAVTEGGATDTYSLVLNSKPTANVVVTLTPSGQLSTSVGSVTFTPTNWNVAQTVMVTAANDTAVEGNHTGTISHKVTSSDPSYNNLTVAPVSVAITDNDANPVKVLLNAGGNAYTDSTNQTWSADKLFFGGSTYTTTSAITGTTSDPLFQTERFGQNFSYAIPVANSKYNVNLGFAEIYFNAAGKRVFDVTAEGKLLLDNLDIWKEAGSNNALVKSFAIDVTDGTLNLNFASSINNAKVAFIQVTPSSSSPTPSVQLTQTGNSTTVTEGGATDTYSLVLNSKPTANVVVTLTPSGQLSTSVGSVTFTPTNWNVAQTVMVTAANDTAVEGNHTGTISHKVISSDPSYNNLTVAPVSVAIADNDTNPAPTTTVLLNAGGSAYTGSNQTWSADKLFFGGSTYTTTSAITGTTSDPLFQTERFGQNFSYAIPVANGKYNVNLGFAEIYFNAAGKRVFDVTAEGKLLLDNLDIWKEAGSNNALVKSFAIDVTDGTLNLNFASSINNAKVAFIDVHPYSGGHGSHPFLHVVIDAPTWVIDYDGDGDEVVPLFGNESHTHEFEKVLTSYTWKEGSTTLGTKPDINTVLDLGLNQVSLTIADNNTPPETLTDLVNINVYPINAVGGVLTKYYPTFSGYFNTQLDSLPSQPGFIEILPSLKINEGTTGLLGSSPYTGDTITVMGGKFLASTSGSYTFQVNGGVDNRLYVNGKQVTGAISLTAGVNYNLEARVARNAAATAPIEILASLNGGTAKAIATSSLTHDQSKLAPFINSMPTSGSKSGGEIVTIKGVGFFEGDAASKVKVHWGNQIFTGTALSIHQGEITFVAPPGDGKISVKVETPNGFSAPIDYNYVASTVPISFATPQVVANMSDPTQAAWGPDGRLYVGSASGVIKAYTFNDNYNVTGVQTINALQSLSNKNILGIAFNPYDATGQPKIYVAHNQLFANGGAGIPDGAFSPYSGQVSVLTGPNFSTITPLITGLPVSNHDHGINGMTFDDAGNLLIAVGGNTNTGVPADAIGDLPESPLSGAIVKATITDPNFDGSIDYVETATKKINNNQVFGDKVDVAPGVDVKVYAPGFRNPFDIVWTTDGLLYGLDNGPNKGFGATSTSATTQAPDAAAPDELNLILEDVYYGHPNRNRGRYDTIENVYKGPQDKSIPGVYMAPLATLDSSTNGIDEYRATTFNSQMRGNLLAQKWNGKLYSFNLSADGKQVTTSTIANNPTGLDILTGPGGVLVSVDYQDDLISVSKPIDQAAVGVTAYDIFPWRAPAAGGGSFVIGGANFGTLANTTVSIGEPGNAINAILTQVASNRIYGILPTKPTNASGLLDVTITSAGETSVIPDAFKYLG